MTATAAPSPRRPLWDATRQRAAALRGVLAVFGGTPRILRLVWRAHPGYALAVAALNTIQGFSPLVYATLAKLVVDAVAGALDGQADAMAAAPYLLALVGARAAFGVLDTAVGPSVRLVWLQLSDYFTRDVQSLILKKAQTLRDASFFESPRYHDLLQKAQAEAGYRPMNVVNHLTYVLRTTISLISMMAVLLTLQPLLPLVVVAFALPRLILQFRQQREKYAINNWAIPEVRQMAYLRRLLSDRADATEGRLFGLGQYFLEQHDQTFERYRQQLSAQRVRHWRWNVCLAVLSTVGWAAAYWYVVLQAVNGHISVGSVMLYVSALGVVQGGAEGIVWQSAAMYESNLFAQNLFQFLDLPPALQERLREEAVPAPVPLRFGIEFRNVAFAYPKNETEDVGQKMNDGGGTDETSVLRPSSLVLQDVSFSIRPGQTVALVGENGAGKTTIVKLLTRLYDPTVGQILVDGTDLRNLDLDDWRRQIGVVFQDLVRYGLVARENIGIGSVPAMHDLAAVQAAAARGGADAVVARLDESYETMLGRRFRSIGSDGADLSGGEWQKVALSRAFMRAPSQTKDERRTTNEGGGDSSFVLGPSSAPLGAQLLILDEPTAALDARAEHDLFQRFQELTRGRSTLLISHRFSTVRMADHIVVLGEGRIKEQGSHEALMALGGEYARLYTMQAERYE